MILEAFGLSTSANIMYVCLYMVCLLLSLTSLVTTFLTKILSHNSLLNTLLSSQDVQLKICHSWLRCLLSGPSEHVLSLTQSVHTHTHTHTHTLR